MASNSTRAASKLGAALRAQAAQEEAAPAYQQTDVEDASFDQFDAADAQDEPEEPARKPAWTLGGHTSNKADGKRAAKAQEANGQAAKRPTPRPLVDRQTAFREDVEELQDEFQQKRRLEQERHQAEAAHRPATVGAKRPAAKGTGRPAAKGAKRPAAGSGRPSVNRAMTPEEARRRAQQAKADPHIPTGLTPTGTGMYDADPKDTARREGIPLSMKEVFQNNWKYILLVVAVVVVLIALIAGIRSCSSSSSEGNSAKQTQSSYQSPYTWSNLDRSGGLYTYTVDGQKLSRVGVDVSENQGDIDWEAVAASGVDYSYVRLGYRGTTEGDIYLDSNYFANMDGSISAGLDTGVYFFSQATTPDEAREEAEYVLTILNGLDMDLPIAFDSEENAAGAGSSRTSSLSDEEMTAVAQAFCQAIEDGGYKAIVYGNTSDLSRYDISTLEKYGVWYAEYGAPTPGLQADFLMWQYTNEGQVDGISTSVDINLDLTQAYKAAKGEASE